MRIVATLFTLLSLAATALAGQTLWQEIATRGLLQDVAASRPRGPEPQPPEPPAPVRRWPPLFGERQPPAPPAPPPAQKSEPQPPPQPVPPLRSLGYALNGIVRSGDHLWALVTHPTGQFLLRVGEPLAQDIVVVDIDDAGVWLSRSGNPPELLGFSE